MMSGFEVYLDGQLSLPILRLITSSPSIRVQPSHHNSKSLSQTFKVKGEVSALSSAKRITLQKKHATFSSSFTLLNLADQYLSISHMSSHPPVSSESSQSHLYLHTP